MKLRIRPGFPGDLIIRHYGKIGKNISYDTVFTKEFLTEKLVSLKSEELEINMTLSVEDTTLYFLDNVVASTVEELL